MIKNQRIGQLLIDKGYLTPAELELGLAHQRNANIKLGESLIELGLITPDQLNDALGDQYEMPVVELYPDMLSEELWGVLPESEVIRHRIIPIFRDESILHIVTYDPNNLDFIPALEKMTGFRIEAALADRQAIEAILLRRFSTRDRTGGETGVSGGDGLSAA